MLSVSIFNVARYLTDSLRGPVLAHYSEADRPSLMGWDGMDGWMDGWDGISKVSFNFFHTLQVYRLCIYLHVYKIKIVTNIFIGFKISCQFGGRGQKFQNYNRQVIFLFFGSKSSLLVSKVSFNYVYTLRVHR